MSFKNFLEEQNDPEVLVHGYGTMRRSLLQKGIIQRIEDALDWAKKGEFAKADWIIRGNGVLPEFTKTEAELEKKDEEKAIEASKYAGEGI